MLQKQKKEYVFDHFVVRLSIIHIIIGGITLKLILLEYLILFHGILKEIESHGILNHAR